jgi:hypothetical protein
MTNLMTPASKGSAPAAQRKKSRMAIAVVTALTLGTLGGVAIGAGASSGNFTNEKTTTGVSAAVRAVSSTLPSVAILGESAGPGGTTVILVQSPGATSITPLYVLADNKTVISGSIVQPLSSLGSGPGNIIKKDPEPESKAAPAQERSYEVIAEAKANTQSETPALSIPAPPVDVTPPQQSSPSTSEPVATIPAPVSVAEIPAPPSVASQPPSQKTTNVPVALPAVANTVANAVPVSLTGEDAPLVFDSIDAMVGVDVFAPAVMYVLSNDADIDVVRNQEAPADVQATYYELVKSLPAIIQGTGPRHVYVMFDPNCPVCHTYYAQVQRDITSGRVTVHWLPAIIFSDERSSLTVSAALAASIGSEDGGSGMLNRVMTEPGYIEAVDASDRVAALTPFMEPVLKNTAVMAMVKAETPLLIFETSEGGLSISGGIPEGGYINKIGAQTL